MLMPLPSIVFTSAVIPISQEALLDAIPSQNTKLITGEMLAMHIADSDGGPSQ